MGSACHLGDFPVFITIKMMQQHGFPLRLRKASQRFGKQQAVLRTGTGPLRAGQRRICLNRIRSLQSGTQMAAAQVHSDCQQVAFQVFVLIMFNITDKTQKGILRQIVGVFPASDLVTAEIENIVLVLLCNHV